MDNPLPDRFGPLLIDYRSRRVMVDGERVRLTRTQFDLLAVLARSAGRVVGRDELMKQVWGHTFFSDADHISVHVHHIRRALGDDGPDPVYIETVRGSGYLFLPHPNSGPNASPGGTVTLHYDADSILVGVTPDEPFLGWMPGDLIGKFFSLAGLDEQSSRQVLHGVRLAGGFHGRIDAHCADGTRQPVEVTVALDAPQTPGGYTGTFRTID